MLFEKLLPNDNVLHREPFIKSEVQYNLIHLISSNTDSNCIKSKDGNLIFVQSPGNSNGWVWITKGIEESHIKELIDNLIDRLGAAEL